MKSGHCHVLLQEPAYSNGVCSLKTYMTCFEEQYMFESEDDRDVLVLQKINPDRERFPDRTVHRREIERVALCVGVLIRKK